MDGSLEYCAHPLPAFPKVLARPCEGAANSNSCGQTVAFRQMLGPSTQCGLSDSRASARARPNALLGHLKG